MKSNILRILSATSLVAALLISANPASAQMHRNGNTPSAATVQPRHGHIAAPLHHRHHHRRIHDHRIGRR